MNMRLLYALSASLLLLACTTTEQRGTPVQNAIVDASGGLVTLTPNQRTMRCNGIADCRDKGDHLDQRITLDGRDLDAVTSYPGEGRTLNPETGGYKLKPSQKR